MGEKDRQNTSSLLKMEKTNIILSWSGGKDSALTYYKLLMENNIRVSYLITTVNEYFHRISMHGVREELLEMQAGNLGIPLVKVMLPEMPDMATYERAMENTLLKLKSSGSTVCAFGDIFLEDLRRYREDKLSQIGMKAVFPLWKIPSERVIREFIDAGFKSVIVTVNEKFLDKSFLGRTIDEDFLRDLPHGVDPCGEHGEYHSFVYDGPIFKKPIPFELGEFVYRKYSPSVKERSQDSNCFGKTEDPFDAGFWYCDLLLPRSVSGLL